MNEIKLEKRTDGERQAYLEGFEAGKRAGICIGQRTGGWTIVTNSQIPPNYCMRYLIYCRYCTDFGMCELTACPFESHKVTTAHTEGE